MMAGSNAALLDRRRAPRIIAHGDLELRRRGLDEPASDTQVPASDTLRSWVRVLELSFVVSAFEEGMARIGGITLVRDIVREMPRLDAFVRTVTRLDVRSVLEENREQMEAHTGFVPLADDAPADPSMPRVVAASRSLLQNCPIATLEQIGADHGLEALSHRCRLAFDGLTALVARNSQPLRSAVTAAGQAYAEGRLSINEVAAVLDYTVPDTVALLEEQGYRRSAGDLRLSAEKRALRLKVIRDERLARGGVVTERPDWIAREVIASQRIEDIDARPWLRS